ncbi:MAG: tetratricopeptide repeat protein, partial [bacterium]
MERILKRNAWFPCRVVLKGSIRRLFAAGLAFAIFTAMLPVLSPVSAWGQSLSSGIEEFRARRDLRDSQQAGRADETVRHALAYLKKFPEGRFYDEMLLALANARSKQGKPRAALRAYKTLIEKFPDSPFRGRALFDSLAPLVALGKDKDAYATVELLIEGFPDSVMRGQALFWKARALAAKGESAEVVRTLKRIRLDRDLPPGAEPEFLRLQVVHLTRSGEPAWTPLQNYLKTGDSDLRKAEVLILVAETARKGGRAPEAFQYYRQVAEDYPVPSHLGEGLFWRAELFARHRLPGATKAQRPVRLETAIGYYSAYLKFGGEKYAVQARLGRAGLNRETDRPKEALADYETAVALDGSLKEKKEITKARIELHITLGQKNKAALLLGTLFKGKHLKPGERIAYRLELAGIYYEERKCENVEQLLNPMPIIADRALRPRATFMRGFCRFHLQQWKKASLDLEKLINDPEYHALVQKPLLSAYQQSRQYFRLANLIEELLLANRLDPSAETFQTLAEAYQQLNDPAMLLAAYRRLEKLDAKAVAGVAVQLKLAKAEQALGRQEEAETRYRALMAKLNRDPGSDPKEYLEVLRPLVAFHVENKHFEAAEAVLETASGVLKDPAALSAVAAMKRSFFLQWGNQAIREGGPENAIRQLKEALAGIHPSERSARDPVALMLIAGYLRGEKPGQALKTYLAELGPQAEAAKRADFTAKVLKSAWEAADVLKKSKKRPGLIDFLNKVLVNLPPERSIDYYHSALVLDRLHQEQRDYPARIALMTSLRGIKLEEKILREIRR